MASRDNRGRYLSVKLKKKRVLRNNIVVDHNYCGVNEICDDGTCKKECSIVKHAGIPNCASRDSWRSGRRVIELGVLLEGLRFCGFCRLGPIPLTLYNVVGELRKGLGGYLYVRCENPECQEVNRVAYGKTHRLRKAGMPCFAANTKLGIGTLTIILFFFKYF